MKNTLVSLAFDKEGVANVLMSDGTIWYCADQADPPFWKKWGVPPVPKEAFETVVKEKPAKEEFDKSQLPVGWKVTLSRKQVQVCVPSTKTGEPPTLISFKRPITHKQAIYSVMRKWLDSNHPSFVMREDSSEEDSDSNYSKMLDAINARQMKLTFS